MGFFMKRKYRDGVGELAPGLVLPADYQREFRKLLARIEDASSAANCLLAAERAGGAVDGLAMAKAIEAGRIERLYLLIDDASSARLLELELEQ